MTNSERRIYKVKFFLFPFRKKDDGWLAYTKGEAKRLNTRLGNGLPTWLVKTKDVTRP